MITILYGLVCWISGDIAVDHVILTVTMILDLAWITAGAITNKFKLNKKK